MNLVGKIFTFLIFSMSLVFMSFSVLVYATHKNWKDEVLRETAPPGGTLGWKKRLENAQLERDRLDSQKRDLEDQLASERALRRQLIAKLEAEKERLVAAAQASSNEYDQLMVAHNQALVDVQKAQDRLTTLDTEVKTMRQEIVDARSTIDNKYQTLLQVTEQANQAKGVATRLARRNEALREENEKAKKVLEVNDLTPDTPVDDAEPSLDGFITRVQEHNNEIFVEITIGSDDGLRQGHTMEVMREGTWLGRVEIVRTTPDRAVGKLDRRTQRGELRPRDRVETRRSLSKI